MIARAAVLSRATMRNIRQENKYGVSGIILRMTVGRDVWL